jgi:hypothetical protein
LEPSPDALRQFAAEFLDALKNPIWTLHKLIKSFNHRMSGADHVFVDGAEIAKAVLAQRPDGFDKVLDLVGVPTLKDSLRCSQPQGVVCMTETMGNVWSIDHFVPMATILQGCAFDHLWRDRRGLHSPPLQEIVDDIATCRLKVRIGNTFLIDEIVEAHRRMEEIGPPEDRRSDQSLNSPFIPEEHRHDNNPSSAHAR